MNPRQIVTSVVDCLCKQDIPEVEAVIRLLTPLVEAHWRDAAREASDELQAGLAALSDSLGAPAVDALAPAGSDGERRPPLEPLLAAFLLPLRTGVSKPLSPARQSAVRESARLLVQRGGASLGLRVAAGAPGSEAALTAAERDLVLLLRGRLESRVEEAEALVETFLNVRTARKPAAGRLLPTPRAPALAPAAESLQAWRARLDTLLGLRGPAWIPQTVDVWAYRWFNIGAFLAVDTGAAGQGALLAQNNPPAGPDARTTPFCRWVHGKIISVTRARFQVERYTQAALAGDYEGLRAAWPLLSSQQAREGTAAEFNVRFAQLGLPPYHFRCRTRPIPRLLVPE